MKIEHLKSVSSTQTYLTKLIKSKRLSENMAVLTYKQTQGIGSRGNSWIGEDGNLFFSVAIQKKDIPKDIPMQSLSIYFSTIMKEILFVENKELFLKWPNDFYIYEKKVGGTVTSIIKDFIIIGIGINRAQSKHFGTLKTEFTNLELVQRYLEDLSKFPSWKVVFEKYSLEFEKSRKFSVNMKNGRRASLKAAKLNFDGSILLDEEIIFSLR